MNNLTVFICNISSVNPYIATNNIELGLDPRLTNLGRIIIDRSGVYYPLVICLFICHCFYIILIFFLNPSYT